jgi:hypothetical protein
LAVTTTEPWFNEASAHRALTDTPKGHDGVRQRMELQVVAAWEGTAPEGHCLTDHSALVIQAD